MLTIHKYDLKVEEYQTVGMPIGFKVLKIGIQNGEIRIWARVNDDNPKTQSVFRICGTGRRMPHDVDLEYIDSVVFGDLVWHIFLEKDNP